MVKEIHTQKHTSETDIVRRYTVRENDGEMEKKKVGGKRERGDVSVEF